MATMTPAQAKVVVGRLLEAIRNWRLVDAARAKLPPKYRAKIPASRLRTVQNLLAHLMRRGALQRQGSSVGTLGLDPLTITLVVGGGLVLIAGAAALAVVAGAAAVISREWRLSKEAVAKTETVKRAWALEQTETKQYGAEAAAARRTERLSQAAAVFDAGPAPAPLVSGGGDQPLKFHLPWWVIPAAIGAGALLLFGGQKAAPVAWRAIRG